ncbi:MAG: hypothetical protein EP335_03995 [Alphaproteobacteria bacterium]|nr:MAG: hypothetical protein EP335_03995 [Alphaproteobacteria bacterium]
MGSAAPEHGKQQPVLPRGASWAVKATELALVILLGWQAAHFAFALLDDTPAGSAAAVAGQARAGSKTDVARLLSFDPFSRQIRSAEAAIADALVPESSLRIEVFGLRAMGEGQGSAIIKMQSEDQKLVRVGDDLSNDVRLVAVYTDRLEISRAGVREAVYLRPKAQRAAVAAAAPGRPAASQPRAATSGLLVDLSALELAPERRDGRIIGFRLGDRLPAALGAVGLEAGDILLAANGAPLASFERLEELPDELAGADRLVLDIERRGERRTLTVPLRGN